MRVSFIIPHKGREELLHRTIDSILNLECDLTQIEIIVVTQNAELSYRHEHPQVAFKAIFRPERETISALRNVGVKEASGEFLAFIDADIELSRNWLAVMFEEFETKPGRVLISAVQRCEPDAPRLELIRTLQNAAAADVAVEFLDGRNLFLPRQVFEQVGGFPEHLVTCEDYFFTYKIHQLGEMYRTSKATYIHLGEDKRYDDMFRKEIWRGQSNLQSLKGRSIPLREWPSILSPLWIALWTLVAVIGVALRSLDIFFFSIEMYFVPVLLYAIRLYRLGKGDIGFGEAVRFYLVYFPARAIGTVEGLFKIIKN